MKPHMYGISFALRRLPFMPIIPGLLALFSIILPVFLGYNIDPRWYYGCLAALPCIVWLAVSLRKRRNASRTQKVLDIRSKGREDVLNPGAYREHFLGIRNGSPTLSIDDRTCLDLSIEEIFSLLDRTVTLPGANMLYTMLRTPLFDTEGVERRRSFIAHFLDRGPDAAQAVSHSLGRILHPGYDDVTEFLLSGTVEAPPSRGLCSLGTLIAVASIVLAIALPFSWDFLLPLGAFILSMVIYYRHYGNITRRVHALGYICDMIRTASEPAVTEEIRRFDPHLAEKLRKTTRETAKLLRMAGGITTFSPGSTDVLSILAVYIKIFFLIDIHLYRRILRYMEARRDNLQAVYEAIGMVDALQSIAAYRSARDGLVVPEFSPPSLSLTVRGIYHPLLEEPVANTVILRSPGIVITGSNMAGKSTFLRTVALNVLLSQTVLFCFAEEYEGGFFFPVTSIEKRDSVTLGKSLYYDEARRIYDILESTGRNVPILCVIDELLSGTNSTERRKASVAVLEYLSGKDCLVISATHDLATAELLEGLYENLHFADRLDAGGLDFDYLLKPGILGTCNAIDLLERIGYPADVVTRARSLE